MPMRIQVTVERETVSRSNGSFGPIFEVETGMYVASGAGYTMTGPEASGAVIELSKHLHSVYGNDVEITVI